MNKSLKGERTTRNFEDCAPSLLKKKKHCPLTNFSSEFRFHADKLSKSSVSLFRKDHTPQGHKTFAHRIKLQIFSESMYMS